MISMSPALEYSELQPQGLRQRKKLKTQKMLEQVAEKLFLARGYDETTVDDIADYAEVSRRTVFRYYQSKDDIVFSLAGISSEWLGELVRTQPSDLSDWNCVCEAIHTLIRRFEENGDRSYRLFLLIEGSPSLRSRSIAVADEWAQAMGEALVTRHLRPSKSVRLRCALLARIVVQVFRTSMQAWAAQENARPLGRQFEETVVAARDILD